MSSCATFAASGLPANRTTSLTFLDSRRLTGPGLLLDRPGAALEIQLDDPEPERAIEAWRAAARLFTGGASLTLSAPLDSLYAATDLNEWAWETALSEVHGDPPPDFGAAVKWMREAIALESNPRLIALCAAARNRGVTFLSDAEFASAGSGWGSVRWPVGALPNPEEVDWDRVHDIPIVLVTGSNGKTTVVRLLAAMIEASGRAAGTTSTDDVRVGGHVLDTGDYSGPGGARLLLRQREVETAVLETARGGLLRRGLEIQRADAAIITNVADDHLGEFGVQSLAELAETKLLVARAVKEDGAVVLNADDAILRGAGQTVRAPIIWFSLEAARPEVVAHVRAGGKWGDGR